MSSVTNNFRRCELVKVLLIHTPTQWMCEVAKLFVTRDFPNRSLKRLGEH